MNKNFGLLINGKWLKNKKTIDIFNPFDGKKISAVSSADSNQIKDSIKFAHSAFQSWSKTSAKFRSEILKKLFKLTIESKNSLSEIITLESGKPLEESKVEVEYGASFIEWAAEQALRSEGKLLESPENNKKMFYIKRPVGVVVAITPWNFPLAMVTRKVSAALAAGCTVILKPSELTPLTALKFGELAVKAGLPNGVLNIINGNPKLIGELLTKNSLVKKITFTGSTKIGKLLMKDSSSTVKNISLELGGNAPFVVFADADISNAIEGFIAAKFRNAGQTCISANRLFVEEKIFDIPKVKKVTIEISPKTILFMKENMKEEINFFEKKFKFKSTFSKNENLLSNEFKINFLNNKNKILDTYSEISVIIEEVKKNTRVKTRSKKKVRKNFKRKKAQKK